jgi:phage shock protein C
MEPQPDQPERARLHRSRQERLLFGVCGGLAEYFGVDPTIVRVAFVVAALLPPLSALSVVGYALLAVIVPAEGAEHLPGREALGGNLTALRTEVDDLADKVSAGVARLTDGRRPAARAAAPAGDPAAVAGATAGATAEGPHPTGAATPAGTRE